MTCTQEADAFRLRVVTPEQAFSFCDYALINLARWNDLAGAEHQRQLGEETKSPAPLEVSEPRNIKAGEPFRTASFDGGESSFRANFYRNLMSAPGPLSTRSRPNCGRLGTSVSGQERPIAPQNKVRMPPCEHVGNL
jgi:hypothetical protein